MSICHITLDMGYILQYFNMSVLFVIEGTMNTGAKIGKKIKQLRIQHRVSQERLAERTGIRKERISKIENGKVRDLRISTILRLAEGLAIPAEALL